MRNKSPLNQCNRLVNFDIDHLSYYKERHIIHLSQHLESAGCISGQKLASHQIILIMVKIKFLQLDSDDNQTTSYFYLINEKSHGPGSAQF